MPRRKLEPYPFPDEWLEEIVKNLWEAKTKGTKPVLSQLLQSLINAIMLKERELFLKNHPENSANGFYHRNLYLSFGNLDLKVPRVRIGHSFRPAILPERWKRIDKDYEELLIAMLANGYSKAQIQRTLKKLGLPYSEESLEDVLEFVQEKLDFYRKQPLKPDWFAVFIDAYWGKIKDPDSGTPKDLSVFVALGIDFTGNKHILGFWPLKGRESKAFWIEVLQDLINRGLKRPLLFVTDDFRGLTEVIKQLFPYAQHQLCLLHLQRNLKAKLPAKAYRKVRSLFAKLRVCSDRKEGEVLFAELCQVVKEEYRGWGQRLEEKAPHYLAFLDYPQGVRKHIYSTNPVESINAGLERMAVELGNYFPSERALEVNLFVQMANLQDKWWRRPLPTVQAVSYELQQKFILTYELEAVL
jgi:transposase-like protein